MAAPTRWGIASSGLISHDFANALSIYPEKHKVVAVAARSIDRAKEFANKFDIKNAHGRDGWLALLSFLLNISWELMTFHNTLFIEFHLKGVREKGIFSSQRETELSRVTINQLWGPGRWPKRWGGLHRVRQHRACKDLQNDVWGWKTRSVWKASGNQCKRDKGDHQCSQEK